MIFYENTMEDIANSLNLTKEYFEYVISGLKTVEGRINNENFSLFILPSTVFNPEITYSKYSFVKFKEFAISSIVFS